MKLVLNVLFDEVRSEQTDSGVTGMFCRQNSCLRVTDVLVGLMTNKVQVRNVRLVHLFALTVYVVSAVGTRDNPIGLIG